MFFVNKQLILKQEFFEIFKYYFFSESNKRHIAKCNSWVGHIGRLETGWASIASRHGIYIFKNNFYFSNFLVSRKKPFSFFVLQGPLDFCSIKANVKVSSTENGIIFGNIVYDCTGAASDRNVVVLNDIHIDIMDYIVPAACTEPEFRQMWAVFEWENKVNWIT